MKIWLLLETICSGIIALLTILAGVHQSETINVPADGQNHLYFAFLLQFLLLNMLPHNISQLYLHKKMLGWRLRRLKIIQYTIYITDGVLTFGTWVLGMTVYNAGFILDAIPTDNFVYVAICMMLYCYILYWGVIGIFTIILALVWLMRKITCRRR